MIDPQSPKAWANTLSRLWGRDRFPMDIECIALDISAKQPDPILKVASIDLEEFEGGLFKREKGWILLYSDQIQSPGRIRFTIAHEFGHYLLHRQQQDVFECSSKDIQDLEAQARQIEDEADQFAAALLIPIDDFRELLHGQIIDLNIISLLAERYEVSLLACLRRWIELNYQRAVMVVSRDGFIKWSRSTKKAMQTKNYFSFAKETIAIPTDSIAARSLLDPHTEREGIEIPARTWFPHEPADMSAREMRIVSDQFDLVITLIVLPDRECEEELEEDELLTDTYTNFINNGQFPD